MAVRNLMAVTAMMVLAGCMTPSTTIERPLTAKPVERPQAREVNGAIYQAGYAERPLFEDIRARNVGDTLTINLVESTAAAQKNANNASRAGSANASIQGMGAGLPLVGASSANKSANSVDNSGSNVLSGVITVTVIEVLANGNLAVAGEKLVGVNQVNEYIRFYGVVNPRNITSSNTVQSTQVADAHIEYKGADSNQDSASLLSKVSRFFQAISPF